ncbi:succinate dehydrogenase/fumarate reductase, membrane anchor subunit [Methylomarinovum caldicuralii]|uniref:Succinate dehydrogenase hydrophobic membrane anchor subunit n=1 Tax=Methylomarinovum caldicuralii TaxID=438856 RepID=A0AAU9C2C4_9GAMM|nr:succinate dehydrogenase/fumarate reductase, membrane anchor subunit [Methylomarinovum caldicuralii]
MDLRTAFRAPLARALGLGSAHSGSGHWWLQRLTAIALVPLTGWLIWFLVQLSRLPHSEMLTWLARPWQAGLLLAYLVTAGFHAALGLQVVIEDYVHHPALKLTALIGVRLGMGGVVLVGVAALIRIIATGGAG